MKGVTLNNDWSVVAPIIEGTDGTNIPGLKICTDNKVRGPIDAVSVYFKRAGGIGFNQPVAIPLRNKRLREFQRTGSGFILNNWQHSGSAMLTDEMGLGKTLQAIAATDAIGSCLNLIVAPRSVALTWRKEIKKWSHGAIRIIRTRDEAEQWQGQARWTVVSYDLLQSLHSRIYTTIIIDEAHNFSGRTAKRGKALKKFCALAENRLALTGTEIWSRPRDYWFLFHCLFGTTFGNRWDFDHAYCDATENEHGGLNNSGASRLAELRHRVSFYRLRRLKRDVARELPKSSRDIRWIDGTPKATALMKAAFLHRNRGAYQKALAATLDDKMEAAIECASEAKKFLLFTWTKRHAASMYRTLNENGTPCFLLTGDVSAVKRAALISLAAKKGYGIVATLDTLKEGVDGLQHVANIGIFHALDFVPLKLLQGEKRLDRIGQTLPVQWIYILMKESMDVWINETVLSKLKQWEALMGEDEGKVLKDGLAGKKSGQSDADLERAVFKQIYRAHKRRAA